MCRFIAYLGKKPVIFNQILDKPENSLINQSRQARESKHVLNADGFGIGWYDHAIDDEPGLFKSVQPAWNDQNLCHMTSKIRATCFAAHVRASTIGNVNILNCHPFAHQQFLFVHNGRISGFKQIKRQVLDSLNDETFDLINGQTDSEHFFALLMDSLFQNNKTFTVDNLAEAMHLAIHKINSMQQRLNNQALSILNTVLTDGKQMIATRYISDRNKDPLSLHYTLGDHVDMKDGRA
ncbi:MAG: class II glutamine amidotransferase [Gammaproteobacteria bacterium]